MLVPALILLVLLVCVAALSVKVVGEGHRLVVLRAGRVRRVVGPGLVFLMPLVDRAVDVDLDGSISGWQGLPSTEIDDRVMASFSDNADTEAAIAQEISESQPWLRNAEWASRQIHSSTKSRALILLVMAMLWNAGVWLVCLLFWTRLVEAYSNREFLLPGFLLVFLVAGVFLLITAARETMRWRKFGICTFELETLPGVIGGRIAGTIHTALKTRPDNGVKVKLACQETTKTKSSKSGKGGRSRTHMRQLWQYDVLVPAGQLRPSPHGVDIPVEVSIPEGLQPTCEWSEGTHGRKIDWFLIATSSVPSVNFRTEFTVPVFKTVARHPKTHED